MYKPQNEFPLIEEYRKVFPITDNTIFAYDHIIYTNYVLPPDLVIHEQTHHKQQDKYGLKEWVQDYLTDEGFRLKMEIQAYSFQLKSIKDRELRNKIRIESANHLSSSLYGNLINFDEAFKILKV